MWKLSMRDSRLNSHRPQSAVKKLEISTKANLPSDFDVRTTTGCQIPLSNELKFIEPLKNGKAENVLLQMNSNI